MNAKNLIENFRTLELEHGFIDLKLSVLKLIEEMEHDATFLEFSPRHSVNILTRNNLTVNQLHRFREEKLQSLPTFREILKKYQKNDYNLFDDKNTCIGISRVSIVADILSNFIVYLIEHEKNDFLIVDMKRVLDALDNAINKIFVIALKRINKTPEEVFQNEF